MPGMRWRTIASAQRTPKIVLSGTATAAISTVSFSANTANGLEIAAQNGCHPCSNARQKISTTGATRITARYASDVRRIPCLTVMPSRPAAEGADRKEDTERDHEQQHRERSRAGRVVAVEPLEHVEGRDLRLEGKVAGDEDDRPELADRARKGKRDPREERRQEMREDDPFEDRDPAGAERRCSLLHLAVQLDQHRLYRANDERKRHEEQRHEDAPPRVGDVDADAARRAVEREQRESGHD